MLPPEEAHTQTHTYTHILRQQTGSTHFLHSKTDTGLAQQEGELCGELSANVATTSTNNF